MERSPIPQITNLEMISIKRIPGVLCNHLVNQNRQISRLQINNMDFNEDCSVFTEKLPDLRQLSLLEMNSMDIFKTFESYPATLNLEKFQFHCGWHCPFVPWSRLLNVIGSKINSDFCTDIRLKLPDPRSDAERLSILQDSLLCRLKLANIQRCRVDSWACFSLDFLLDSKNSLREIKLNHYSDLEYDFGGAEHKKLKDKQVIKFYGCEEKMEESNIAEELPRLRKLEVINYELKLSRHYTQLHYGS